MRAGLEEMRDELGAVRQGDGDQRQDRAPPRDVVGLGAFSRTRPPWTPSPCSPPIDRPPWHTPSDSAHTQHHKLIYKHVHKPHHKWIVPTPYAALAFHPVDGYAQSLPYQ